MYQKYARLLMPVAKILIEEGLEFSLWVSEMGVNTLSKLKLKSKLRKQTNFKSVFRINTLSKFGF